MADEITSGYTKSSCRKRAGVKSFIPIDLLNLKNIVIANGVITTLTTRRACFRFTTDVNLSTFNQTPTAERANGSYMVAQTGTAILTDNLLATDLHVDNLIKGYQHIVVEYQDGTIKFFGQVNAMTVTTAEMTSGTAGTDLNGSTINWEGDENNVAPHIEDAAIIAGLLSDSPHS